jgi:beta-lactam-binding protein with PASTA domain
MRIAVPLHLVALGLLLTGAACGSTRTAAVPDVIGNQLNAAEDTLDAAGLRYRTVGGGTFGILVRSRWTVCRQSPAPKTRAKSVTLFVARSCTVPGVVGLRLDDAEDELEEAGYDVDAHSLDGGPVIVQHFWAVCRQSQADATTVDVFVSHDCSLS